jgi:hypothetical protein
VILIHVHREKFSEPTEYGTMNTTGGIMSLYSSNTKRDHANPARHILSVQDQRQDGYFQEVHLQNITKEIVETIEEKEHLYKRRQAIVEHHYGTLKRQWGFSYILTKKGIERASSDVGFMFIAYNLRRIGNILTRDRLKEYFRILVLMFLDLLGINFSQLEEKSSLNLA